MCFPANFKRIHEENIPGFFSKTPIFFVPRSFKKSLKKKKTTEVIPVDISGGTTGEVLKIILVGIFAGIPEEISLGILGGTLEKISEKYLKNFMEESLLKFLKQTLTY